MANPVQIANLALSWLGQGLINAFTDNQTEAKVMEANYELSRDKVLADHAWTFAMERQTLAPLVDGPQWGSENRFLIPSNVLRVYRVYRANLSSQGTTSRNLTPAHWERSGKYILANESTIWAVFIMKVTDSTLFSPGFVHALAARMAADTCMTLTENRQLLVDMEALYDKKIAEAQYSEGSQGRTEIMRSDILTGARKR
jgi:hypothetical protein